ncbi:MAG: glycosyltransferase [Moraxella sp.]|nr:glycosyltransferase [Moraxella sp.]
MNRDTTLCLTIGKRPDELKRTLESLFVKQKFANIIAINDFGDDATSDVFRALCPHGRLIELERQVGHHQAVDAMYRYVKTPYILHCEDDWLFDGELDLTSAKLLLECEDFAVVCFRDLADFPDYEDCKNEVIFEQLGEVRYARKDHLHEQWHGFTFNPHLTKTTLWQSLDGGFSHFKKERHISRYFKKHKKIVAFIQPASCRHIGENISVANPNEKRSWLKKIKSFLK